VSLFSEVDPELSAREKLRFSDGTGQFPFSLYFFRETFGGARGFFFLLNAQPSGGR